MKRKTIKDDGPDPIDKFVGSRVRARRVGLRITQTKLGDAIGVTFQQVQKYENGTNRISASRLYHIAKTLSVTVAFLFKDIEDLESSAGSLARDCISSKNKLRAEPIEELEPDMIRHIEDMKTIPLGVRKDIMVLADKVARV